MLVTPPVFEDNEASLPELEARIAKTLAYLESVPREQLDGTEEKQVSVPSRGKGGALLLQPRLLPRLRERADAGELSR